MGFLLAFFVIAAIVSLVWDSEPMGYEERDWLYSLAEKAAQVRLAEMKAHEDFCRKKYL